KPEKIREWLPKAVEEFHLNRHEETKEPRDQYGLADDPALKPLKEAYLHTLGKTDPQADQFAGSLLKSDVPYKPFRWPPRQFPFQMMAKETEEWDPQESPYLYWVTETVKARVPSFEEAKDKVLAAWQLQSARTQTAEVAQALAKEAEQTRGEPQ